MSDVVFPKSHLVFGELGKRPMDFALCCNKHRGVAPFAICGLLHCTPRLLVSAIIPTQNLAVQAAMSNFAREKTEK